MEWRNTTLKKNATNCAFHEWKTSPHSKWYGAYGIQSLKDINTVLQCVLIFDYQRYWHQLFQEQEH